ncbi:MAG: GNAT family N-acetyltransferase [Pseudomonadota bacterium]
MRKHDILRDLGPLALASRLKRLADTLLADAAKIHSASGEPLQPGQFPLVAALDRYGPMSVNDAAEVLGISQPATTRAVAEATKSGLVASAPGEHDKRFRQLSLTELGRGSVSRMKQSMWLRVDAAARSLTTGLSGDFLNSVAEIERRLDENSMLDRVQANTLTIEPYADHHARDFHDINVEWIKDMFTIEPHDQNVLMNPRENIIDQGGAIYFVRSDEDGIVGTCALEQADEGFVEVTKMGVRSAARGKGAGEFLLRFVLERVREMGWQDRLFLVSNKKNSAAVKLYEKLGFEHDAHIMQQFGSRYERCNVAMRYRGHQSK